MKIKRLGITLLSTFIMFSCSSKTLIKDGWDEDPHKINISRAYNWELKNIVNIGYKWKNKNMYTHKDYIPKILYGLSLKYPKFKKEWEYYKTNKEMSKEGMKKIKNQGLEYDKNFDNTINLYELNEYIDKHFKGKDKIRFN